MQIYIMDAGWAGCIVVIADSEEEARAMMKNEPNYDSSIELEVQDIRNGVVIVSLGDL